MAAQPTSASIWITRRANFPGAHLSPGNRQHAVESRGRSSRAARGPTIARVRFAKFVLTAFRAVDLEDIGYLNSGSDGLLFVASAQPALVRLSVVRNAGANYLFGFGSQLNSPILTRYLPRCREQQNNWSELFAYFTSSGRRVIAK
jgi:hypothetical protein